MATTEFLRNNVLPAPRDFHFFIKQAEIEQRLLFQEKHPVPNPCAKASDTTLTPAEQKILKEALYKEPANVISFSIEKITSNPYAVDELGVVSLNETDDFSRTFDLQSQAGVIVRKYLLLKAIGEQAKTAMTADNFKQTMLTIAKSPIVKSVLSTHTHNERHQRFFSRVKQWFKELMWQAHRSTDNNALDRTLILNNKDPATLNEFKRGIAAIK